MSPTLKRFAVYHGSRCYLCGGEVLLSQPKGMRWKEWEKIRPSRDHVIPRSSKIKGVPNNIRLAHTICNIERGNIPIVYYRMLKIIERRSMFREISVGQIYKHSNMLSFYKVIRNYYDKQLCDSFSCSGMSNHVFISITDKLDAGQLILSSPEELKMFIKKEMNNICDRISANNDRLRMFSKTLDSLESDKDNNHA